MLGIDDYMKHLFGDQQPQPQRWDSEPRMPRVPRKPRPAPGSPPSTPPVNAHGPAWNKPNRPAPTTPATPATPSYSAKNPPPGFTSSQWQQLLSMSKNNSALSNIIKQFTTSLSTPQPDQTWRREMPKDNTQLLRQLSFNTGEMGMPGGYVGAVQMPSFQFGTQNPAINNPNMGSYGQQPGYGEATFYQQSMKGGMAPIAAMSPLGVPAGWNPGGGSTSDLQSQLNDYLKKMQSGGSGGGSTMRMGVGPFSTHWKDPFGHVKPINWKPA